MRDTKPRSSLFVSHSEKDKDIAAALIGLMLKAFGLNAKDIFCISVAGHRLHLSENTDETLRRKLERLKPLYVLQLKTVSERRTYLDLFML